MRIDDRPAHAGIVAVGADAILGLHAITDDGAIRSNGAIVVPLRTMFACAVDAGAHGIATGGRIQKTGCCRVRARTAVVSRASRILGTAWATLSFALLADAEDVSDRRREHVRIEDEYRYFACLEVPCSRVPIDLG